MTSRMVAQVPVTDGTHALRRMRRLRTVLIIVGVLLMLYAVLGAVSDPTDRLVGHATFLLAVLVGHDGLLMPLAIGIGAVVGRLVPILARGVAAAATYVSGVLVFVALPFLLGFGATPDEPSALPLNYSRGLIITLAIVWVAAAATVVYRRRRAAAGPATTSRASRG